MRMIPAHRLMGFFALMNVALVAVGILFPGWVGLWAIFLTSFFMSLMFRSDADDSSTSADGVLRPDECRIGRCRNPVSWLGGSVGHLSHQLLYVSDVPI